MKLLIVGPDSYENRELKKEAVKAGHFVIASSIKEISLIIKEGKMKLYWQGKELPGVDLCLFRGISPFFAKAKTLAKYLHQTNVLVVDKELYSQVYEFDKMFMSCNFFIKKLPCIDSYYFSNYKEFKKYLNKIPQPAIIKDIKGMQSRNVFVFKTREELDSFLSKNKRKVKDFLIQKVVINEHYFRVLVVGGKVLGAMKRMSYLNENKEQTVLARRSSRAQLTPELKKFALAAVKATNADIAGVDLIYDQGALKILESNRSPKFKRFTQIMNINVAQEIINYLEKRFYDQTRAI